MLQAEATIRQRIGDDRSDVAAQGSNDERVSPQLADGTGDVDAAATRVQVNLLGPELAPGSIVSTADDMSSAGFNVSVTIRSDSDRTRSRRGIFDERRRHYRARRRPLI